MVKPPHDPNFDYSQLFSSVGTTYSSVGANFNSVSMVGTHFHTSCFIPSSFSFMLYSSCVLSLSQTELREQRQALWEAGEWPVAVKTPTGRQWMVMLKKYGTIFVYNEDLKTF